MPHSIGTLMHLRSPESLATAIRRVLDEPQFGETMRALREKEA